MTARPTYPKACEYRDVEAIAKGKLLCFSIHCHIAKRAPSGCMIGGTSCHCAVQIDCQVVNLFLHFLIIHLFRPGDDFSHIPSHGLRRLTVIIFVLPPYPSRSYMLLLVVFGLRRIDMQYIFHLINHGHLSAISIDSDFQNGLRFLVCLHYQSSSCIDHLFRREDSQLIAQVKAVEGEPHQGTASNVLFFFASCI